MRWLRLAAPAIVLVAWLAGSFAQQGQPPADPSTPSAPPAGTPPARPPPAPPAEEDPDSAPRADSEDVDDSFDPTEELPPDAAVTFPVDI